jgi:hypothetical protein
VRVQESRVNQRVPFVVNADPLLLPLIPGYLANRRNDLERLVSGLKEGDFLVLRKIGHDMRGSGGAYGMPPLSDIGERIEAAALAGNAATVAEATEDLRVFLELVKLPP